MLTECKNTASFHHALKKVSYTDKFVRIVHWAPSFSRWISKGRLLRIEYC
jgi:hypothetical protein